jgi:hypothetical protein
VPIDPTICETSDAGAPNTIAEPDDPHALVASFFASQQL